MSYPCPVCEKELRREQYEGTTIFRCDQCQGVFAEERRVQRIKASQEHSVASLQVEAEAQPPAHSEERLRCPRCRARYMSKEAIEFEGGEDESLTVDICHDCDSIWFDGGELARLQLDFQQSAQAVEAWRLRMLSEQRTPEEERELEERIAEAPPPSNVSFLLPKWVLIVGAVLAVLVFALLYFLFNYLAE